MAEEEPRWRPATSPEKPKEEPRWRLIESWGVEKEEPRWRPAVTRKLAGPTVTAPSPEPTPAEPTPTIEQAIGGGIPAPPGLVKHVEKPAILEGFVGGPAGVPPYAYQFARPIGGMTQEETDELIRQSQAEISRAGRRYPEWKGFERWQLFPLTTALESRLPPELTSREITKLETEGSRLGTQADEYEWSQERLKERSDALEAQRNEVVESGDSGKISTYNQAVGRLNVDVEASNRTYTNLSSSIDKYNKRVGGTQFIMSPQGQKLRRYLNPRGWWETIEFMDPIERIGATVFTAPVSFGIGVVRGATWGLVGGEMPSPMRVTFAAGEKAIRGGAEPEIFRAMPREAEFLWRTPEYTYPAAAGEFVGYTISGGFLFKGAKTVFGPAVSGYKTAVLRRLAPLKTRAGEIWAAGGEIAPSAARTLRVTGKVVTAPVRGVRLVKGGLRGVYTRAIGRVERLTGKTLLVPARKGEIWWGEVGAVHEKIGPWAVSKTRGVSIKVYTPTGAIERVPYLQLAKQPRMAFFYQRTMEPQPTLFTQEAYGFQWIGKKFAVEMGKISEMAAITPSTITTRGVISVGWRRGELIRAFGVQTTKKLPPGHIPSGGLLVPPTRLTKISEVFHPIRPITPEYYFPVPRQFTITPPSVAPSMAAIIAGVGLKPPIGIETPPRLHKVGIRQVGIFKTVGAVGVTPTAGIGTVEGLKAMQRVIASVEHAQGTIPSIGIARPIPPQPRPTPTRGIFPPFFPFGGGAGAGGGPRRRGLGYWRYWMRKHQLGDPLKVFFGIKLGKKPPKAVSVWQRRVPAGETMRQAVRRASSPFGRPNKKNRVKVFG